MPIKYLKKSPKTSSTDDNKTKDIVQKLLNDLEKSREDGCKELTKKFDKYDGEIIVSEERIDEIKKSFDQKQNDDDLKHENILIDKNSADLLKGSEVDYSEELIGNSFKINNPQSKSSCGCGVSFSL